MSNSSDNSDIEMNLIDSNNDDDHSVDHHHVQNKKSGCGDICNCCRGCKCNEEYADTHWDSPLVEHLWKHSLDAACASWACSVDADYYNSLNSSYNLRIAVSQVINFILWAGFAVIMLGFLENFIDGTPLLIVKLTFALVALVLNFIIAYWKIVQTTNNWVEKVKDFSDCGGKYNEVFNYITMQFSFPKHERDDGLTVSRTIRERMNEYNRYIGFLRSSTLKEWDKYISTVKENNMLDNNLINLPEEVRYKMEDLHRTIDLEEQMQSARTIGYKKRKPGHKTSLMSHMNRI